MITFRNLSTAFCAPRFIIHKRSPRARRLLRSKLLVPLSLTRYGSTISHRWRRQSESQTSLAPEPLLDGIPVDEEKIPGYDSENYYPANPGEVLESRYQLVAKIGWGSTSTVWLARDIGRGSWRAPTRYVAIKICTCDVREEDMMYELDMNNHLSSPKAKHRGHAALATAIEGFSIKSSCGTHLALVFEPLREPLWLMRRRLNQQNYTTSESLPLIKVYLRILLEGLDYMHSQCHVIHTDLKLDNIMVTFEDQSTIDSFVEGQADHPMVCKSVGGRTVYRCHNDFGPVFQGLGKIIPQITDFGLAQRGDKREPLLHPIQPNELRAPEVLLGIGWSYSADIWNFGAMTWELLAGHSLFQQPATRPYSAAQHLAEIIALIGNTPSSLIERERQMRRWRWSPAAVNSQGKPSSNALEFYGGPFFADDGTFLYEDLIPRTRQLEAEVPTCILEEKQVDLFLAFMRRMLRWVPEERATAAELLSDPWLDSRGG